MVLWRRDLRGIRGKEEEKSRECSWCGVVRRKKKRRAEERVSETAQVLRRECGKVKAMPFPKTQKGPLLLFKRLPPEPRPTQPLFLCSAKTDTQQQQQSLPSLYLSAGVPVFAEEAFDQLICSIMQVFGSLSRRTAACVCLRCCKDPHKDHNFHTPPTFVPDLPIPCLFLRVFIFPLFYTTNYLLFFFYKLCF